MLHRLVCLISFPGMDTCVSGSVAEALRSSPVMALLSRPRWPPSRWRRKARVEISARCKDPRKSKLIRSPWRASWLRCSLGALNPFVSRPPRARSSPSGAAKRACRRAASGGLAQGRPKGDRGAQMALPALRFPPPRIGHLVTACRSPCFLCLPSSSWPRSWRRVCRWARLARLRVSPRAISLALPVP